MLTFKFLLHQVHCLRILPLLLPILLFLRRYLLIQLRDRSILRLKLVKALQMTKHGIDTSHHVLALPVLSTTLPFLSSSVLLSTLEPTSATGNTLGVLLAS